MEESKKYDAMTNYWRYFRLDGDPVTHGGATRFTVAIHHGGRFYSRGGGVYNEYKGDKRVMYVDGVVPSALNVIGFHYWANDLGYIGGPMGYWFRIPGSEKGHGYMPINNDAEAMDIVNYMCRNRIIHVYMACLSGRRELIADKLERPEEEVDPNKFRVATILDLELTNDEARDENTMRGWCIQRIQGSY